MAKKAAFTISPQQIEAWVVAIEAFIKIGGYAVSTVQGWFKAVHPALTEAQYDEAWTAIEQDDRIRQAVAHEASGDET